MSKSEKSNQPIRVLQVLGGLFHGGAEAMIMNLYRNVDTQLVQFDFLVHTDQEGVFDKEILDRGGVVHHAPTYTGINHFTYKAWWKTFLSQHPEYGCIHFHIRGTSAIAIPICKRLGRTTIIHAHSTSNGKSLVSFIKGLFQMSLRRDADYLFACSEPAGRWLFGEKALQAPNFRLWKNAIDTSKYQFSQETRNRVRSELGLEESFVVGHIGRFIDAKNHGFLLEIFQEVLRREPHAKLLLIGDGPNRKAIEEKIELLKLGQAVIYAGFRSDVPEMLQAMDVFLFPSLYEGLPVTLIEAQASGLHCVVSKEVPSEVKLTELVEFVSLTSSATQWGEAVLATRNKQERQLPKQIFVDEGYDIVESAKNLQSFYLSEIFGKTD
jgi:glycosyltransferase involved in cell wall biosynthesis